MYAYMNKACHVHVVLSTLYQKKNITEQEVEDLKSAIFLWNHVVQIQCTKSPVVVKITGELLAQVAHNNEGNLLKGQCEYSVYLLFIMLLCHVIYLQ